MLSPTVNAIEPPLSIVSNVKARWKASDVEMLCTLCVVSTEGIYFGLVERSDIPLFLGQKEKGEPPWLGVEAKKGEKRI
jgi:hypothetical protein